MVGQARRLPREEHGKRREEGGPWELETWNLAPLRISEGRFLCHHRLPLRCMPPTLPYPNALPLYLFSLTLSPTLYFTTAFAVPSTDLAVQHATGHLPLKRTAHLPLRSIHGGLSS